MVGCDVSVLFEKEGCLDGQLVGKIEYLYVCYVMVDFLFKG